MTTAILSDMPSITGRLVLPFPQQLADREIRALADANPDPQSSKARKASHREPTYGDTGQLW